jgi:hypothetical protein
MRKRTIFLMGLAFAALSGCLHPARVVKDPDEAILADSTKTTVSVENNGYDNVTVFIEGGDAGTHRLGTVNGFGNGTFVLDSRWINGGAMHLIAQNARAVTDQVRPISSVNFTLRPGSRVLWTLEWNLRRDMLEVY